MLNQEKSEADLNNQRLESLLRIVQYQTKSVMDLLDFSLHEAIQLTQSKIGYIYFYNETTRQFTLNTWSKEAMKQCEINKKQTVYDLDKTGWWGEAVRQRQPILINDYQANNPLKKGIPDGHVKLSRFLTIPVIVENKIVAVVGVGNKATDYDNFDIRQLTLLMDIVWKISERIELIDNLKYAKERAEESDRLKTTFLQNMSHEIHTPVNAIVGFSRMLERRDISEGTKMKYVSIITNNAFQLQSIVDDILTISSIETKQEKVNITKVCINNIVEELLEVFRRQIVNQNITISIQQGLSDQQSKIYTDRTKITQIITNLLSNAMKFTFQGIVEFGYNLKGDQLEFFVKDSGIGIEKGYHEEIFERFKQVDINVSIRYRGTGLGLAISKGFVELLGGKIWVESEPGKGSTFYFTIPFNPVHKIDINANNPIQEVGITSIEPDRSDITILIAEDDEDNHLLIEETLKEMRVNIIHAWDGNEAVEICKLNHQIDLVFMDIRMPKMDGDMAAKLIKEFRPELKIIGCSSFSMGQYQDVYLGNVFDDYIRKPINDDVLKVKLEKLINK